MARRKQQRPQAGLGPVEGRPQHGEAGPGGLSGWVEEAPGSEAEDLELEEAAAAPRRSRKRERAGRRPEQQWRPLEAAVQPLPAPAEAAATLWALGSAELALPCDAAVAQQAQQLRLRLAGADDESETEGDLEAGVVVEVEAAGPLGKSKVGDDQFGLVAACSSKCSLILALYTCNACIACISHPANMSPSPLATSAAGLTAAALS